MAVAAVGIGVFVYMNGDKGMNYSIEASEKGSQKIDGVMVLQRTSLKA